MGKEQGDANSSLPSRTLSVGELTSASDKGRKGAELEKYEAGGRLSMKIPPSDARGKVTSINS